MVAAGFLHLVPTVLVVWLAVLVYVVNAEADHDERIGQFKSNLLERIDPLLEITGFKKTQ